MTEEQVRAVIERIRKRSDETQAKLREQADKMAEEFDGLTKQILAEIKGEPAGSESASPGEFPE